MRGYKKIPHDCERSHTGRLVKDKHNKDILIVALRDKFDKGVWG